MALILSKLHSRTGASLIVTLFLLIVCSTVGSIILTAATANVGRISERAEYDRKYYAVTSAARLFADEIAAISQDPDKSVTLTIERHEDASEEAVFNIERPLGIESEQADNKLQASLKNDIYGIYTGGQTDSGALQTTAAQYWNGDFSNIGNSAQYRNSVPRDFTVTVRGGEAGIESTVYGRFALEASRANGDPNPGLDSVTHNITAVFYSDIIKNDENEIQDELPENAYVIRLVCPAKSPPDVSFSDNGTQTIMNIRFEWQRDMMQITQVRGGA